MGAVVYRVRAEERDLPELPPGTLRVPLRAAGAALAVCGVLLAVSTPLHPNILDGRDLADAVRETAGWRAIHAAWVVSSLLNVFGAAGIVAVHCRRLGRPWQAALALAIIGTTATACLRFLETLAIFFVPVLGPVAAVAFSAVLSWWGWLLWSDGRDAISAERPVAT